MFIFFFYQAWTCEHHVNAIPELNKIQHFIFVYIAIKYIHVHLVIKLHFLIFSFYFAIVFFLS